MISATSRSTEALERLSHALGEYNCAACLQRGFAQADSSPDATQPWDCDFGTVTSLPCDSWRPQPDRPPCMPFWIAKREQLVVDSAVSSQVGLLATRVASAIDGLRETGSPTPGTACRSVVLVGERGVGKTSLLNLLLRLGEPQPEPPPIGPVEPKSRKGPPTDAELEAVGVLNEEFAAGGADEAPPLEKAARLFSCVC